MQTWNELSFLWPETSSDVIPNEPHVLSNLKKVGHPAEIGDFK